MFEYSSEGAFVEELRAHPDWFGYSADSLSISAFKWGQPFGTSDLVILPVGAPRIGIIEAKLSRNPEASTLVVGQLLKYYVKARMWTGDGVAKLRDGLRSHLHPQSFGQQLSPASIFGSESAADREMQGEPTIQVERVDLHVALDRMDRRVEERLSRILDLLVRDHRISINLWVRSDRGLDLYPTEGISAVRAP